MKPSRGRLLLLAFEERQQVEAVEVHLERFAADRVALLHLLDEVRLAVCRRERRNEVLQASRCR